jgi:hypothetical protein
MKTSPAVKTVLPVLNLKKGSLEVCQDKTQTEDAPPKLHPDEETRVRLIAETAKIPWKELQRFFAQGVVILVKPGLDLVDVAFEVTQDNEQQVKLWMSQSELQGVSDDQAKEWLEFNALMWAVVVKPWVLVQPVLQGSE